MLRRDVYSMVRTVIFPSRLRKYWLTYWRWSCARRITLWKRGDVRTATTAFDASQGIANFRLHDLGV